MDGGSGFAAARGSPVTGMRGAIFAVIASASRGPVFWKFAAISATGRHRPDHFIPIIARQQIEGGIVFGLAMAAGARRLTRFKKGCQRQTGSANCPCRGWLQNSANPDRIYQKRGGRRQWVTEESRVPGGRSCCCQCVILSNRPPAPRQLPLFGEVS